jgi:pyridoxine 5-phosphate synthase
VPERREEITTEGGLSVAGHEAELQPLVAALQANGTKVSMFIDPSPEQVRASAAIGATMIELHTGRFANTLGEERAAETARLAAAATLGHELGLEVHAGHGIQIANLAELNAVPYLTELNIGHTIIARAIFTGLTAAVREMKEAIDSYTW